jgi:hypothetical protein
VIFRAALLVTGMPSEVVPGDSTDPARAATAIVASPACDLAVAASIVVAVASVVVVEASEVAVVVAVGAVDAGKAPRIVVRKSQEHGYEIDTREHKILEAPFHFVCGGVRMCVCVVRLFRAAIDGENGSADSRCVICGWHALRHSATGCR